MTYENKIFKCVSFVLATLLAVSVAFGGINHHRLEHYREQCRQYREQLESATCRQQELRDAVNGCIEIVGRTEEVFSSTASTITELRRQLKEVRASYEDMERLLHSVDSDSSDNDVTNIPES